MTSWIHVTYTGEDPPWILKEIPGKGFCAYAARSFSAGEIICTEKPTCWVHGHHPFDQAQLEEIDQRVEELDDDQRNAFYAMSNAFPDAPSVAAGIFMTNCFDMTDAPHGESCAMYLAIARLNHSCTPNAQQTHLPETSEEVLYAARDIMEGEEINDSYIDLRQDTASRQATLQEIYRFTCACEACSDDVSDAERVEDDLLRSRAAALDEQVMLLAADDLDSALTVAFDAVRILSSKKCLKWSVRYLADAYMTVYQLEVACGGSEKKAKKYLQAAHELNQRLTGPRSPDTASSRQKL